MNLKNLMHILLYGGQSQNPDKVISSIEKKISDLKENGISKEEFDRVKKMLHGEYIKQFNRIDEIARMFISDYFKGIDSLEYLDAYKDIDLEFIEQTLTEIFKENTKVVSIVKPKI